MKKIIKKHISLLLASLLVIGTVSAALFAFANDNVEINEENFPDTNFREAIALMYDANSDGVLSEAERNIESMIVSGIIEMLAIEKDVDEEDLPVNSLKGIEFFDSIKSLRCSSIGRIEHLDLSGLDNLENLACNDLGLKSINLSNDLSLKEINVCSNDFENLDFSENINLERIHCYDNEKLKSINIGGLTKLKDLRCDQCAIDNLDLSSNVNLEALNCSYNRLISLDLSANTKLNITEYNIGYQKSSALATAIESTIIVPLDLDASKVVRTNLDVDGTVAFSDGNFFTEDFDNMKDGLTYYYNTGISDSAFMSVTLDITEKEHLYSLSGFNVDNNEAEIKCVICKEKHNIDFADSINKREGDNGYREYLDVINDGIINAKDFTALLKEYNK